MSMSRRLDRTAVRPSQSHASHVSIDRGHSLLHSPSPSPSASPTSNGNSTTSHQSASAAAASASASPAHSMDDDDVASASPLLWSRPTLTSRTTSIPAREDLWTEDATFTLVEAWGDRYIELNRGNLRQKHWQEVANAVNARHGHIKDRRRTDIQCKNRIDTLKKKYKIEKSKLIASKSHYTSPWPFFLRLDSLIGNSFKPPAPAPSTAPTLRRKAPQLPALPPSPSSVPVGRRSKRPAPAPMLVGNSHCRRNFSTMAAAAAAVEAEESDTSGWSAGNHRRREREMGMDMDGAEAYRQLAEAIARFGKIYQRVEEEKQRQMVELEKQKMQFVKDLELQRLKLFMESQVQFQMLKRPKPTPESVAYRCSDEEHSPSLG